LGGLPTFAEAKLSGKVAPIPDLRPHSRTRRFDGEPLFPQREILHRFATDLSLAWRMDNFRVNSVYDLIASGDQCLLFAALPRS
jgi:hypothetical protein